ncbi:MAG: AraC family transcriptional regulator [Schleiferiaceae bacterium]|nr:AraC family transcriptional regulator [Schleiferiaceae bacterium]
MLELKENTPIRFTEIFDGIALLVIGKRASSAPIKIELKANDIFLLFGIDGEITFQFGPMYMRPLPDGQSFFIYNPNTTLIAQASFPKEHRLTCIKISLNRMHSLFIREESNNNIELPFLVGAPLNRPIYDQKSVDSNMRILLEQLFHNRLSPDAQRVAHLGQIMEILGLYFHSSERNLVACPFLKDEETVQKIHQAKSIMMNEWKNPPTIKQLSEQTGLNQYRLKAGFKEIYGTTVYGYAMDTRLNHARRMLNQGGQSVNDVAFNIGYTNPSHFIAAFKKKYGTTPRKYRISQ